MIDLQPPTPADIRRHPPAPAATRYRPTPPRRCDDCRKWSAQLTPVRYQVARQTHWSPAEYDQADLCPACIDKTRRDKEDAQ